MEDLPESTVAVLYTNPEEITQHFEGVWLSPYQIKPNTQQEFQRVWVTTQDLQWDRGLLGGKG